MRAVSAIAILCTLSALSPGAPAFASAAGLSGEVSVDGRRIALPYAVAVEQTGASDDPVTYVLFTEKWAASSFQQQGAAVQGEAGALVSVHLHASGKVRQADGIHPAADAHFPTDIPPASVRTANVKLEKGVISGTVETIGEVKVDGHLWKFHLEFKLPVGKV